MNTVAGYNDNKVAPTTKTICRFYLRGMCRFGNRCRNIHQQEKEPKSQPCQNGAVGTSKHSAPSTSSPGCSKSPNKSPEKLKELFGPSTASESEALVLVRRAQSIEKTCGICFEVILEKVEKREQVFGILPNCNHCYCFSCIRKWRQSKEFEHDVTKSCPECRATSEYVYPSRCWFHEKSEKESFIAVEKGRMQLIDCKYFKKGNGKCPFGNTCMYLHALPNGKKMDVGPPRPRRPRDVDHQLVHRLLYLLNEDAFIDDDDDDDDDFDLDLDDPTIAMQFYDHDDIRRINALSRLMNPDDSDDDFDDMNLLVF